MFGQISNSSLIFYPFPLPIFGLSFKFYYNPPCPVIIKVLLAKISFSKLMPIQSYRYLFKGNKQNIFLTSLSHEQSEKY